MRLESVRRAVGARLGASGPAGLAVALGLALALWSSSPGPGLAQEAALEPGQAPGAAASQAAAQGGLTASFPAQPRPQGQAQPLAQAVSARVLFVGDFAARRASPEIAARPGTRFGMELVVEDGNGAKGAPVVLQARLTRADDPEAAPVVFLTPARTGQSAQVAWEFAYDWEIVPGIWNLEVLCGDVRLAGAAFALSKTPDQGGKPAQDGLAADKSPERRTGRTPEKGSGKAAGQDGGKAAAADAGKPADKGPDRAAEKAAERQGAAKPSESGRDRTPTPLAGGPQASAPRSDAVSQAAPDRAGQGARTGRIVSGPPGRRVYVVLAGSFSEEGRALWTAALLKGQGASPCVRRTEVGGRRLWGVVLGWRDSVEEARRLRDDMARIAKDLAVVPMSAGDLEAGLVCR